MKDNVESLKRMNCDGQEQGVIVFCGGMFKLLLGLLNSCSTHNLSSSLCDLPESMNLPSVTHGHQIVTYSVTQHADHEARMRARAANCCKSEAPGKL